MNVVVSAFEWLRIVLFMSAFRWGFSQPFPFLWFLSCCKFLDHIKTVSLTLRSHHAVLFCFPNRINHLTFPPAGCKGFLSDLNIQPQFKPQNQRTSEEHHYKICDFLSQLRFPRACVTQNSPTLLRLRLTSQEHPHLAYFEEKTLNSASPFPFLSWYQFW